MKMMMKLRTNAKIDGARCSKATHKSAVLSTPDGIRTSIISSVRAIAKTPSQNVSRRAFGFVSVNRQACFSRKWFAQYSTHSLSCCVSQSVHNSYSSVTPDALTWIVGEALAWRGGGPAMEPTPAGRTAVARGHHIRLRWTRQWLRLSAWLRLFVAIWLAAGTGELLPRGGAELPETHPGGQQCGFHSASDLELGQDIGHVVFDGLFRKAQLEADLLIAFAAGHQLQHLPLATAQLRHRIARARFRHFA